MNAHLEIALAVILISMVMFVASWLFQDKVGDKPARIAFRTFYLFGLLFFISISTANNDQKLTSELLTDLFFAITNTSLVIGILWRCHSQISATFIYGLMWLYLIINLAFSEFSLQASYSYNVICSLICVYALLNRTGGANTGDKGMAVVILVHAVFVLVNLTSIAGVVEPGLSSDFMKVVFIFAPAYMAGLTIFLFASYMLDARKELEIQATTDPLTGLYNRRFFFKQAKLALATSERQQEPLCLMMCDIDHFKCINDKFGHKAGDRALAAFAKVLTTSLRAGDVLARYGGEEFVVLLPQTNVYKARFVAERMRCETENITLSVEGEPIRLTASFGVCLVKEFKDIETSIQQADKAMYEAKSAGRNQVQLYPTVLA